MNQKNEVSTLSLEIQLLQSWPQLDKENENSLNSLLARANANHVGPLWAAVYEGNIQIVENLLHHGANPDFKYSTGQSPLWTAAFNGHADLVSLLLKYGASINDISNGVTALFVSVCKGHVEAFNVLMQAYPDVHIKHHKNHASPLIAAAQLGYEKMVDDLLTAKANPDDIDIYGRTALHLARENKFYSVVQKLLKGGATPDIGQNWIEKKFTAWFEKVRILYPEQYSELDAISIDSEGFCNGLSLLWLFRRKSNCYPRFLNELKYISGWDETLDSLKSDDVLQKIFNNILGANIWLKGQHGLLDKFDQSTPDTLLNFIQLHSGTHLLFQIGFVFKPDELAMLLDDILLYKKMVLLHFNKNKRGHAVGLMKSGNKIRLYNPATCKGEVTFNSTTELLDQIHFDVNEKAGNHLGISISVMDDMDTDAGLYKDIKSRFQAKVLADRKKQNEINITDEFGASSIALSAFTNDELTVVRLMSFNAILNPENDALSPVYAACERGNLTLTKILVEAGADINQICMKQTPLQIAVKRGNTEIVDFLIERKAIGFQNDSNYSQLFYYSIKNGFLDIANTLLKTGADINYIEKESGFSSLYVCAIKGFNQIAKFLLDKGARNKAIFCTHSNTLITPVEIAIMFRHLSVIREFWHHGTDFRNLGPTGYTPLQLARQQCCPQIVRFLERKNDRNLFFHQTPIGESSENIIVHTPQ